MKKILNNFALIIILWFSYTVAIAQGNTPKRIVSLSGSLTEIVDALGLGANLVAVDVTSDYPSYVKEIPKVSKNRSITAEGIASFRPDIVLGFEGEVSAAVLAQFKTLNISCVLFKQEFSEAGLTGLVRKVGQALNVTTKGNQVADQLSKDLKSAIAKGKSSKATKMMFVYARGAGAMSVSGSGTAVDAVIKLAGAQNVMKGFTGYKTYNTEALVQANPEVILLFDFGMSSLGGKEAILKLPGVNLTTAGKNKRVIAMDASLLNGFSMRLPQAIQQLHEKLFGK
ncbi:ABC transporter substrate-binding protein [Sphingobacterium sp. PCS056]|uniref:heme/hemin ABC transporter substrate-binding protein n=1 Tax=Sphingobacterium sp. PCS056 TaxID=2931400 RepID=UPI00200D0BF4|nr:ABC transporter substrate-binding protein [Sphingobacterium sp. PCS056]UPZ35005.1 ABC transporter substrate-binding protein [Sphingobacterium sp. PCS056]